MIINQKKYNTFLSILSLVGIFMYEYTYANIQKNNDKFSSFSNSSSNSYNLYSYNQNFNSIENVVLTEQKIDLSTKLNDFIELAKEKAPYSFKEQKIEEFDDEFGKSLYINVYLNLPENVDDLLLINSSDKITSEIEAINKTDKYITVTYL